MSRELVTEICAAQPGAECSAPWGEGLDRWQVGGRTFAVNNWKSGHVAVKTESAEAAEFLMETGAADREPELHPGWIALPLDAAPDEIAFRLRRAYRVVRTTLDPEIAKQIPGS